MAGKFLHTLKRADAGLGPTDPVDLKGLLPESWCCVDCGRDTAPGSKTRAEVEAAFRAGHEEIEETINCRSEIYMVRAAIWQRAGMEPFGGCLCIECLEKRLGRRLKPNFPTRP